MRTITEKLAARLRIQAKEAEVLGLKKLGTHLEKAAESDTRPTNSPYVYAESDLVNDVEAALWTAAVRVADYFDCNIDGQFVQENVEKMAKELVGAISKQAGIRHGVGVFEPTVPGEEVAEQVLVEVDGE